MENPVGIGVKLLLPEANPIDPSSPRYLVLKRREGKNGKEWELPGGRGDPSDANATAVARRESLEEIGCDNIGQPVPVAVQRIRRKSGLDIIRFTTIGEPLDPGDVFIPKRSREHTGYVWLKRRQILGLPMLDSYLLDVLKDGGSLDEIEKSGVLFMGAKAIEAVVRRQQLLG